jgi:hypothetical protein
MEYIRNHPQFPKFPVDKKMPEARFRETYETWKREWDKYIEDLKADQSRVDFVGIRHTGPID